MCELISIIVPVYNVVKYLDQCVKSLLRQSYNNIEIILVDDGSKDNSGIKCDEYAKLDSRIKVIRKENGGLSDARNCGLEHAKGDYIVFVDSDDWLSLDCVEYLLYLAKRYSVKLSICELVRITDGGKFLSLVQNDKTEFVLSEEEGLQNLLLSRLYSTSVCGKMFAKELFSSLRFPKGKLFEDIPVSYSLFLAGIKSAFGSHVGYFYRTREESITTIKFTSRRMDAVEFIYDAMDKVEKIYPNFSGEANLVRFRVNFDIVECLGDDVESKRYWTIIHNEMKKYRKSVLTLNSASRIDKIKALLSVFDYHFIQQIIKLFKKLKQMKSSNYE